MTGGILLFNSSELEKENLLLEWFDMKAIPGMYCFYSEED